MSIKNRPNLPRSEAYTYSIIGSNSDLKYTPASLRC